MSEQSKELGLSRESPDDETTMLVEEMSLGPNDRLARVMHLFEFRVGGIPTKLDSHVLSQGQLSELEVIGVVGTIRGKEGLFAQCGWFGNHDLDWFWCVIRRIRSITPRKDRRFREGELCIWLSTDIGDYALLLPHQSYSRIWVDYLNHLGPLNPGIFTLCAPTDGCPTWWCDKTSWPFLNPAERQSPAAPVSGVAAATANTAPIPTESEECFCAICLRRDEKVAREGIEGFEHGQWSWSDMESKRESELAWIDFPERSLQPDIPGSLSRRQEIDRKYIQLLTGAFALFLEEGYWPINTAAKETEIRQAAHGLVFIRV